MQRERVAYVGTVPFEPPLLYQTGGNLVGPDAELAERIVERIDATRETTGGTPVKLTWINRTYPSLVTALKEEVHFIVGAFGITEDRRKEIDFSEPYYSSELVLAINPVSRDLTPAALTGRTIGVREGTAVEAFVTGTYSNSTIVPYETLDEAILSLRRSEVDCVIDDKLMVAYSLATTPGAGHLEIIPEVLGTIDCAVGVRKGDEPLLEIVNSIIAEAKEGDQLAQWTAEHAGNYFDEVGERRVERLRKQAEARKPRAITVRVTRERGYDFDIYTMANLRFIFKNTAAPDQIRTSRVQFSGSTGICRADVPPGKYMLLQPKFNFSYPVEIFPTDGDRVTVSIQVTRSGVQVSTKSS
jgi:ABC-type amino acid transport substrate-binding protein